MSSILLYPREEKSEKKSDFILNFFEFFLVSGESHSVEKCERGPLGVFEHPFFCKIGKNERVPFRDI